MDSTVFLSVCLSVCFFFVFFLTLFCALFQEAYIADLDAKSGASLKLTILNPHGRIWTMVAGGGASVIYSDTICDLGGSKELANYGEYSGAPSESQTFEYAKTILGLMTREQHPEGKVLIIGGGIANFTNVAATFKVCDYFLTGVFFILFYELLTYCRRYELVSLHYVFWSCFQHVIVTWLSCDRVLLCPQGIVRALTEFCHKLQEYSVKIFVRRGGPNYQEGLRIMRELGAALSVCLSVCLSV